MCVCVCVCVCVCECKAVRSLTSYKINHPSKMSKTS